MKNNSPPAGTFLSQFPLSIEHHGYRPPDMSHPFVAATAAANPSTALGAARARRTVARGAGLEQGGAHE